MPDSPWVPNDHYHDQHDGSEGLAINNTFFRRNLTLLALKVAAPFFRRDGACVPISKHLIVKTGMFVHLSEAVTMSFVAEKTSIPVPRVYCSFVHKNQAYIVMERIRADSLAKAMGIVSDAERDTILAQLRRIFQELRALPAPAGEGVESCISGSLRDSRIARSNPRFGPFKTIQDFHRWLRYDALLEDFAKCKDNDIRKACEDMARKQDGPWPTRVFTHGDLNPFNILVRGDQVVSIIDWEFAGWYPHYWEFTSAWYGNLTRLAWQVLIDKFLDPVPEELQMEITRQEYWGL